jgi:hypothetical protein
MYPDITLDELRTTLTREICDSECCRFGTKDWPSDRRSSDEHAVHKAGSSAFLTARSHTYRRKFAPHRSSPSNARPMWCGIDTVTSG